MYVDLFCIIKKYLIPKYSQLRKICDLKKIILRKYPIKKGPGEKAELEASCIF